MDVFYSATNPEILVKLSEDKNAPKISTSSRNGKFYGTYLPSIKLAPILDPEERVKIAKERLRQINEEIGNIENMYGFDQKGRIYPFPGWEPEELRVKKGTLNLPRTNFKCCFRWYREDGS